MDVAELSMILETLGPKTITDDEMSVAAEKVRNMKGLPKEHQIALYGLYKQYHVGNVNIPQPSMFNFKERAKWYEIIHDRSSFVNNPMFF